MGLFTIHKGKEHPMDCEIVYLADVVCRTSTAYFRVEVYGTEIEPKAYGEQI